MNKKLIIAITLLLIPAMPLFSAAGDYDGSKPLICAVMYTQQCDWGEPCTDVTAEAINLPRFLWINLGKNIMESKTPDGGKRTSRIEHVKEVDSKLILQGAEQGIEGQRDGFGWTVAIMEDTGDMVLTASGDFVGIVAFGSCTTD